MQIDIMACAEGELPELLTPKEAAAVLKVSMATLRGWRYADKGPPVIHVGPSTFRYPGRGARGLSRQPTAIGMPVIDFLYTAVYTTVHGHQENPSNDGAMPL